MIKEVGMEKCTCGHEKEKHFCHGCTKCMCSEFTTEGDFPRTILNVAVIVEDSNVGEEDSDEEEDKSD
jgi:hypothetical protein